MGSEVGDFVLRGRFWCIIVVEVDEVGLGVLPSSLWTISGTVAYLSAVEAGIVCVSSPLNYSSLIPSLAPSSLATSPSPVGQCTASG